MKKRASITSGVEKSKAKSRITGESKLAHYVAEIFGATKYLKIVSTNKINDFFYIFA